MELIMQKELISSKQLCRWLAVGAFIVLTTLSAFVRIPLPFTPVPVTLQTFFVLLSGALLGRKLGLMAQGGYMFLGLTGQQVFTGLGSGSIYLLGPTGGYIVGFILAAYICGKFLAKAQSSWTAVFIKLLAADFIILFSGTLWLKISLACSFTQALALGFAPFILTDIFKVFLATVVYQKISARIKTVLG